MTRPKVVALVAGTGTEVGKTWVTCRTAEQLRAQGLTVVARKPAQSFDAETPVEDTDAGQLAEATGETAKVVCVEHRWYDVPMAPPMAAAALDRPAFTIADLAGELTWSEANVGFLEGAGGVRSPIADDGDLVDLAALVRPDLVVLVAHAALGVLNVVRLSVDALADFPVVVHLNHHDPGDDLHLRNLAWLRDRWHLTVTTTPLELASHVTAKFAAP